MKNKIKRSELRDLMDKRADRLSKQGQREAARYLRSKEVPATRGNIRAGIAFMILMTMIIGILLVL